MEPYHISGKRSFRKFYLNMLLVSLFFGGMGSIMLGLHNEALSPAKEVLMFIMAGVLYVLSGYNIVKYIQNTPSITVDKDSIWFNKTQYNWSEVKVVALTGKQSFNYLFTDNVEGAKLLLNGETTKYIYDNMYSNAWEIKSFIQQVVIDKREYNTSNIEMYKDSLPNQNEEVFEYYKGTAIFSLRGIMLWSLTLLFAFIALTTDKNGVVFPIVFIICWFYLCSNWMYYIGTSKYYLSVHNHNFFWFRKYWYIKNIKEVVFETRGKLPNSIRVVTKDFKTELYMAGTLSDKQWVALKADLKKKSIKVRNEIIL